jgi:serine/threonine protein phosphatase 1
MRTLVIGDIHGCHIALDTLLQRVQPQPDDLLITLGDYVDRGPGSRQVIDRLIALQQSLSLIALRGNHDEVMRQVRQNRQEREFWLLIGGIQTLASYGHLPEDEVYDRIPATHWAFLDATRRYYQTETHVFAHATLDPNQPLVVQTDSALFWEKLNDRQPIRHQSGKVFICGHTRQESGLPLELGTTICIDTAVYQPQGWLTCLDVQSGQYYQANQRGEWREGTRAQLARRG